MHTKINIYYIDGASNTDTEMYKIQRDTEKEKEKEKSSSQSAFLHDSNSVSNYNNGNMERYVA